MLEDELYPSAGGVGGVVVGRTHSIYQQQSTGEKHVLFYPTSPQPSINSEERRSWSQASLPNANANSNHRHYNSDRMKKGDGGVSDPLDSGGSCKGAECTEARSNFKIGIYGWRKRCLYILILTLLVMVIINLALTLWVLKVMEFSSEGMGQLKIVSGGLRLDGKTYVLDSLIASKLKSRTGQPIIIESSKNVTLTTRNKYGHVENMIFLGNDRFECLANNFKVMDDRGVVLFSVDDQEVHIGAHKLSVSGQGGTTFTGSVQTPMVTAKSGHELRLESLTRSIDIHAPQGVHIESRGGRMRVVALKDIELKTEEGFISLNSRSIVMPSLPTVKPVHRTEEQKTKHVYQLCVCENGRLFLAPSNSVCATDDDDRVCR